MPARRVLLATFVSVVMLYTVACTDDVPRPSASPSVPPRTEPPDGAHAVGSPIPRGRSQSDAEARRDGVPRAVARQTLTDRIHTAWVTVTVDDATWIASRGSYHEYGEVLLMNNARTRIRRAFPLDGVPPHHLAVTEDAVFCARSGDGALPHSMACRIDPRTNTMIVRVFAAPEGEPPFDEVRDAPEGWELDDDVLEVYEFAADDAGLWAKNHGDTWTKLDPDTLEIVERDVERVTSDDN